jgi:hypothetical protein
MVLVFPLGQGIDGFHGIERPRKLIHKNRKASKELYKRAFSGRVDVKNGVVIQAYRSKKTADHSSGDIY